MAKFLTNLDLNKNQLQNSVAHKLAAAPSNPIEGLEYFNTADHRKYIYNGTQWVGQDAADAAATDVGAAIHASSAKTVLVDADVFAIINSESGNVLAKTTFANLKARLKLYTDTLYNNYTHPNHTGDVTSAADGATTIGANKVTLGMMAQMATGLMLGRATAGTGNVEALTATQIKTLLGIDTVVTNSHTHTNKALLDTYTQTEANLADAVSKKHSQNTDVGTSSATFYVGTSGVKLKNSGGTELQIRNNADSAYADLRVKNLVVEGDTTSINSNEVNIGDSEILLNSDIATSAANSDGGIAVKRLKVDNTTRNDAKLIFNNSTSKWQVVFGPVAGTLVTADIAAKFAAAIGDGTQTSFVVTHNLNSQDVVVSIREVASPYEEVFTTVKMTDANSVTIEFAVAPTASQYRVTVVG